MSFTSYKSNVVVTDEPVYRNHLAVYMDYPNRNLLGNWGVTAAIAGTTFTTNGFDSTSGSYSFVAKNSGGVNLFAVRNDGFVGINTLVAVGAEKLRVNGSIYCDSELSILGAVKFNGSGFTAINYGGAGNNEIHMTAQGGVSMYDAGGAPVYFKYLKANNDGDSLTMVRDLIKAKQAGLVDTSYYVAINVAGTPNTNAILQLDSTTRGFMPPRMTTAQRTAMALGATEEGIIVFDTDLNQIAYWTGAAWTLL